MAYTHKPSGPPVFDAKAFVTKLLNNQPITQKQVDQFIAWKQWVESTNAYDGVAKGGVRDILNALCIAVDKLKLNVDAHGDRLDRHAVRLDTVEAWIAAQPRPFP